MLQTLINLANYLDSSGHSKQSAAIDSLIKKAADITRYDPSSESGSGYGEVSKPSQVAEPPTSGGFTENVKWFAQRQKQQKERTQDEVYSPEDRKSGEHKEKIEERHRYYEDIKDLLQDIAGNIESELGGQIAGRLDMAHSLRLPHIELRLADGGLIRLEFHTEKDGMSVKAVIKHSDGKLDTLQFPIDGERGAVGADFVTTVAERIANKLER